MSTRRNFLSGLGAAIAGAALDPERLLWVPGQKLISIPRPRVVRSMDDLEPGDILTFEGLYDTDQFGNRSEHLLEYVYTAGRHVELRALGAIDGPLPAIKRPRVVTVPLVPPGKLGYGNVSRTWGWT